jgi:hypothetical protein
MSDVKISKRAAASNGKNPLDNYHKLRVYTLQGSAQAKKQAKKEGVVFTIIKNNKVYKVFPDGREIEDHRIKMIDQDVFEPIVISK